MIKNIPFNFILLGISASLPYFVTGAALTRWLRVEGIDLSDIGLISLGGLIVALNFLWSPLINNFKIPILSSHLGLRKSWLALSQILLALLFLILSFLDPTYSFNSLLVIILLIFFVASVQDISLDAYRVEYDQYFSKETLASSYVVGWRTGTYLLGGIAFSFESSMSWPTILKILSLTMFCLTLVSGFSKRVTEINSKGFGFDNFLPALRQFFKNKDFLLVLMLIGFFRLSDTVLGYMAYPFYTDVGFSGKDLAIKNLYNFFATFAGAFIAIVYMQKTSLFKGLFFSSITILFTNILFSFLTIYPSVNNLIWINFLDTFAQAFATACFLAFLVSLIDRKFTAIQHAIFTSLMLIPGYLIRGYSGFFVETLDYYNFFLFCGFLGIPSVLLTYFFLRSSVFSIENLLKISAISLGFVITLLSLADIGNVAPTSNSLIIHFVGYFMLSLCTFFASRKTFSGYLICALIVMGILIEIAQYITGLRNFEYMDIIANSIGVLGGYIIYKISNNHLKFTS